MEEGPNGQSEQDNGDQPLPGPSEVMCLNGVNRNHEIVAEARVPQKGAILRVMPPYPTVESNDAQGDDGKSDEKVDRQHGIEFHSGPPGFMRQKIWVKPLQPRPKKTKAGLDCGAEICLAGGQLV